MEIGGYFGLEYFSGREYHEGLIPVNNARSALLYLLKARKIQKLYIPRYLCDSVSNLCRREGYAYAYYPIGEDFMPCFSGNLGEGEYLYVVNYFGQLTDEGILSLKERYGRIIVDHVQAFFQKPLAGVDTLYSCRKFFGVPDGGYVATDARLEEELETDVSKDRMKHILGRFEDSASPYYGEFKANDHGFATQPLRYMSRLTHNLLRAVDYERARNIRNENYDALARAFGGVNPLNLRRPDGPYAYPLYCAKGMEIKKKLAAKGIYVATLWPNALACGGIEEDYARNILPLPCDQRYGPEHMQYMIEEVFSCINSEN